MGDLADLVWNCSITNPIYSALLGAGVGLAIAAASLTNALTPHTPHP